MRDRIDARRCNIRMDSHNRAHRYSEIHATVVGSAHMRSLPLAGIVIRAALGQAGNISENRPQVVFKGKARVPVALIGLEGTPSYGDGCWPHFGTFVADSIAYDGVSDVVAGIRVKAIPAPPPEAPRPAVGSLVTINPQSLSEAEKSWVATLVRPVRKLLIAHNRCGNGGYDSARDIYAVDAMSW